MIDFSTFQLDNGLRIVHSHDPQTAMVVLDVLYDTGSRDERADLTGMAHLFEHLMFGGSCNVPSFDAELELAGGTNNAATSNDFTFFYDVVPAQNAETAFWLESDRMLALSFSDHALEVQRSVVIEEFKQTCLNRPYGKVAHHLMPLIYTEHPYRWPVIGLTPEHIERVTQKDVRDWFFSHYAPNNAILAVVGNITLDETRRLAEKWFGPIPSRPVSERRLPDDPWLTAPVRSVVYDNVPQTAISIAYRMDPYGIRGYLAADAITDILSAGKSARFNRRLVLGTDIFTSADASISGFEHSGLLYIQGRVTREDPVTVDRAVDMLIEQARLLAVPGDVSEYELQRAKNRFESTFTFENMHQVSKAQNLARAVYHNEDINTYVSDYQSLSLDDITRTARELFIDHAPAILITRPRDAESHTGPTSQDGIDD